uniref:SCP domain-containing protein n=1 Tax=Romanomermis culicivorax TaxID=13658 RepID=A0A915IJL9_ROMCU
MHELVWDVKLAETAQLYAEQCIWQHSGYVKHFELGECLWSSG